MLCCFGFISFQGKRVKDLSTRNVVQHSGNYVNVRQVTCEALLEPREHPYTLFASTYHPDQQARFQITAYSDRRLANLQRGNRLKWMDPDDVTAK